MATTDVPVFEAPVRTASSWTSTQGFRTDTVPWRLYEKAKQGMWDPADIDFFRRWFDAVGVTGDELLELATEGALSRGIQPPDPERTTGMFESELPRVMRAAMLQRSPETILNASLTYNQWIEACLAISGYRRFAQMFNAHPGLPGLQEGLRLVRTDEGRHITYGTYLCRRIIAAHPELMGFARDRLEGLYTEYQENIPVPEGAGANAAAIRDEYARMVRVQKDRRIQILEKAALLTEAEAESDRIAEEVERELAEL